jgi:VanZ family protein
MRPIKWMVLSAPHESRQRGSGALRWTPPFVYALLIFFVSAQPDPLPAVTAVIWDKFLHCVEYGVLALLVCRACRGERIRPMLAVALTVIATSAYAATDEWHQFFVPGRNADVLDWLADSIGAAAASMAYLTAMISRW